jgi:hypothetical protein
MSNRLYDILKKFCLVWLPALTTFYGVLGATLNIPYTQEVITIAVAFDTMLGTILGISSKRYYANEGEDNGEDE